MELLLDFSPNDNGDNYFVRDKTELYEAIKAGLKDDNFRRIVVELCQELKTLCKLDETVHDASSNDEISVFVMEISSLLKELNCPYKLVDGPASERFETEQQRATLFYFLWTELMAVRAIEKKTKAQLTTKDSEAATDLKNILLALKFPRPPDNVTSEQLFSKVETKIADLLKTVPPVLLGKPLLNGLLTPDQIQSLNEVYSEMRQEYKLRREMLLKRLDVTVQSFEWSESAKGKSNAIASEFVERRNLLLPEPNVQLSDVIAARSDLAIIQKTSCSAARKNTQSSVHKVIIGRVPDRGGRPSEQAAPPPEMPSWQKERAQGGGGGGPGRGGFSRGGGRVQGGWNQHDDRTDDRRGGGRGRGGRGRNYR